MRRFQGHLHWRLFRHQGADVAADAGVAVLATTTMISASNKANIASLLWNVLHVVLPRNLI